MSLCPVALLQMDEVVSFPKKSIVLLVSELLSLLSWFTEFPVVFFLDNEQSFTGCWLYWFEYSIVNVSFTEGLSSKLNIIADF